MEFENCQVCKRPLFTEESRRRGIGPKCLKKITTKRETDLILNRFTDVEEEERIRECGSHCSHFDLINQCCWQAGTWGLCFDTQEGDICRLGYKEVVA